MAAPVAFKPPTGTHPAITPKVRPEKELPLQETETSEDGPSIFKAAYRHVRALGQRWRSFGRKFREGSIRANSNWITRRTSKRLSDFRKMY